MKIKCGGNVQNKIEKGVALLFFNPPAALNDMR